LIDVSSKRDGEMVRVVVRDTGIGISEENLNKIFNPFIQIDSSMKRSFEGTGLGLALVKKFVEMHGGNIRVESKLDEGTAFTFELPASPQSGM
jgi:two-component system, sporulation sensor kinase E